MNRRNLIACLIGFAIVTLGAACGYGGDLQRQSVLIDLSLPAATDQSVRLHSVSPARLQVVCFLGCECPLAKLYAARLQTLAVEFSQQDVRFVGINSNPQDSLAEVAKFAADHALTFPMLKDHDGLALDAFAATRTPEVVMIDSLGRVLYRGRVDDQYRPGVLQAQPTRDDLREAILDCLDAQPVRVARTDAAGCLIAKSRQIAPSCEVTYCGQIAVLLQKHCIECHCDGEIGPFSMSRYEDVVGWADMMMETIDQQRMPPWHATDDHEPIANARRMETSDRELLRRWIDGGLPYGDAEKLPQAIASTGGWQLERTPDLVLDVTKQPFHIKAEGVVDYQYFVVDPGFKEDTWIASAEILPGNRAIVHHVIAFIRAPDGVGHTGMGLLTAYVPGQRLAPLVKGLAKKIPAGSKLVFQMHYTPTGSPESDLSRIGLLLARPDEVTDEAITIAGINHELEIPPGESNVRIDGGSIDLPLQGRLLSISPHMHLRGKSVQVSLHRDGTIKTLLDVPHYDFNWQHTYHLQRPIELRSGESLSFIAHFDNSAANPFNPDPKQFVTWGDQTYEEMAIVFYEISRPVNLANQPRGKPDRATKKRAEESSTAASEPLERHVKLVDDLMHDLDTNADGSIDYEELPPSLKWRLFWSMDASGDRQIDREEALKYVKAQNR